MFYYTYYAQKFMITVIPQRFQAGIYVITLLDNYAASYSVLLIAFFETLVIAWVYGIDKFAENIEEMEKRKVSKFVKIFVKYVTIVLVFVSPSLSVKSCG